MASRLAGRMTTPAEIRHELYACTTERFQTAAKNTCSDRAAQNTADTVGHPTYSSIQILAAIKITVLQGERVKKEEEEEDLFAKWITLKNGEAKIHLVSCHTSSQVGWQINRHDWNECKAYSSSCREHAFTFLDTSARHDNLSSRSSQRFRYNGHQ